MFLFIVQLIKLHMLDTTPSPVLLGRDHDIYLPLLSPCPFTEFLWFWEPFREYHLFCEWTRGEERRRTWSLPCVTVTACMATAPEVQCYLSRFVTFYKYKTPISSLKVCKMLQTCWSSAVLLALWLCKLWLCNKRKWEDVSPKWT